MEIIELIAAAWLVAINIITFAEFGIDKRAAILRRQRTPEATLIKMCAMGGAFGGFLAMHCFHHKTRKPKFFISVPFIAMVYAAAIVAYIYFCHFGEFSLGASNQVAESLEEVVENDDDEPQEELYTIEDIESAIEAGGQNILDQIKEIIQTGKSSVTTLRQIFLDKNNELVVVDSDNIINFIAVLDAVPKHSLSMENLVVLESGEIQYVEDGEIISAKGIDVSKYQGSIDWAQVADDGVEYAFIRVGLRGYSGGNIMADSTFDANVTGAATQGIKIGVYFFSQAITEEEAIEEADFVLNAIGGYKCITYPIVIDIESVDGDSRADALSMEERTAVVKAFCERVEEAGYTAMIYGNLETFTLTLDLEQLADYQRWISYYDTTLCFPYEFSFWQYSASGTVAGISGEVDMNISFYTGQ